MSVGLRKYSKIRHILRLRQMLQRWRNKARISVGRIPADVPAGHVAVYVGMSYKRFVVLDVLEPPHSDHSGQFINIEDFKGYCHLWTESRPLLHGFAEKTI
ncbi:SMALL AUXIN UPREGULATED RNA 52 [Hibiscus trionum]|uniref:SMALL AUXIN UPREGULATED RNA 52 n=1 Tax=Hibiscus trionum TaxID=183268 RepID=A0A9W7MCW5_HIBTR|nr:SMALL AUXIN UPREGULATED RNA 52 [Hibiscus trionum]